MSCRIELTKTEYDIADLSMSGGDCTMQLCGLQVRLIRIWTERAMPHPHCVKYWAEISRIMH